MRSSTPSARSADVASSISRNMCRRQIARQGARRRSGSPRPSRMRPRRRSPPAHRLLKLADETHLISTVQHNVVSTVVVSTCS